MPNIWVSLITSIIISGTCCYIYYRRELAKQKEKRRKRFEVKLEEWKKTKPKLYEILRD